MIRQGRHWSDAQIAYDRDPRRLVTCEHLQPIERAMRDAGIVVRPLHSPHHTEAACRIDEALLEGQFCVTLPVWYRSNIPGDRPYDPEAAGLVCRDHGSAIWVIHPAEAKPATPVFP